MRNCFPFYNFYILATYGFWHFASIIDSVFLLAFQSLQNGNDIEYIKLSEQIFDCILKIRQAGLNNSALPPTAEETDNKYQDFFAKQCELNHLIKQLFCYSKLNRSSPDD